MDKKLKILIISYYFPSLNSIASFRPYSWAKYWSKEGHDITVLTVKKEKSETDFNFDLSQFNLIEVESFEFKIINGIKKLLFIKSSDNTFNTNTDQILYHMERKKLNIKIINLLDRFRKSTGVFYASRMPDFGDFYIRSSYKSISNKIFDIVVSTFGPYYVHLLGLKMKRNNRTKVWIADYRDLWTQNDIFPGIFPFTLVEEFLERKVNSNADIITTVSEPLAEKLKEKYRIKNVEVITNGFDSDFYNIIPKNPLWTDGKVRLVYTGTIYKNHGDPSPLFEAIKRIESSENVHLLDNLDIIFVGRSMEGLIDLIKKYNVYKWVNYKGFVRFEESLQMQRDAHGLIFLDHGSDKGIVTGKIFEYLFSGTQILGIGVSEQSFVGKLIKESGHGIVFENDVNKIEKHLIHLLKTKNKPKVTINYKFLHQFSREYQAKRLLNIAKQHLNII